MKEVVWIILRQENRFLLVQGSLTGTASGIWVFPGGNVDPNDKEPIGTACRKLKKAVGLEGHRFRKLCHTYLGQHHVQVFCCDQWSGELKPACDEVIGIGWFTLPEMYALGHSLEPFVDESLMYLAWLTQHYDDHPNEWREQWRKRDENG